MSQVVLRAVGLGKRYRLGDGTGSYETLRESLVRWSRGLLGNGTRVRASEESFVWALRDVSFEVREGEVLGIVGANGAGKSTLLKILARIAAPTEGWAELRGRVGSLLEVGTGFHPELTGRENIYLSGAILGMRRREIAERFDEIVAFAEIERFLDTPVKRYSSGMYVRLAFAVAAHLHPEILLVDEVLAVGDVHFQRKCLGKMGEVARGGRTVLFVSHNMAAIERLCHRAILLEGGKVAETGRPAEVVRRYLRSEDRVRYVAPRRTGKPQVLSAEICTADGRPTGTVFSTDPFYVRLRYVVPEARSGLRLGIGFLSSDGQPLCTSNTADVGAELPERPGEHVALVRVPPLAFLVGEFQLATCVWDHAEIFDLQEPALAFRVEAGASPLYAETDVRKGFLHVPCEWRVDEAPESAELDLERLGTHA